MARKAASGKPERPARRWQLRRDNTGTTASRPGTGKRAVRRGRRGLRAAAPYALVASVVMAASVAVWVLLGSTLLGVQTVSVLGSRTVSTEQVARAAAIPVGTPLARLDTAGAAARIGKLAAVASVHVRRSWPNTVVVTITERTAVAVAARGTSFVLLDVKGTPYRTVAARPAGLPLVRVAKLRAGDPATVAAITVARALTPALKERLTTVTAGSPSRVEVQLRNKRSIFWGPADDSPRKAQVATALLGESGTRIDVSAPDVATVR